MNLHIFLEPLRLPMIKSAPGEIEQTNHMTGRRLAATMAEALDRLKNLPLEQ